MSVETPSSDAVTQDGSEIIIDVGFRTASEWAELEEALEDSDYDDAETLIREATLDFIDDALGADEAAVPEEGSIPASGTQPDHQNPELLKALYEDHDGNITELYRSHDFDASISTVRRRLQKYDIHEPQTYVTDEEQDEIPPYRDPDVLEPLYQKYDGNVSDVHRNLVEEHDVDVTYSTVGNWIDKLDIRESSALKSVKEHAADEASADVDDQADADDTPDIIEDVISVDDVSDAESFGDLETPDWLDEGSFYVAAEMSEDIDDLADTLGWNEFEHLEVMVGVLDVNIDVEGGIVDV
jgi:hypothetical protein